MRPEQLTERWARRTAPVHGDRSFMDYPVKILDVDYRRYNLTIKDVGGGVWQLPWYWMDDNWEIGDDPTSVSIWQEALWVMKRGYVK